MTIVLFKTYVFFAMLHQSNIPLVILYKDQYANKTRVFFYDEERTSVKREVRELHGDSFDLGAFSYLIP